MGPYSYLSDFQKLVPVGALTSATAGASGLFVFPVTTSSVAFNLAGANYVNLLDAIKRQKVLKIRADAANVYYQWAIATGTVDETALASSSPANQAELLSSSEREDIIAPDLATFLMLKGSGAGHFRVTISEYL